MCKSDFCIEKWKLEKINLFFPGKKVKCKKAQLFPTIFLMKIMKKSPVMKLMNHYSKHSNSNQIYHIDHYSVYYLIYHIHVYQAKSRPFTMQQLYFPITVVRYMALNKYFCWSHAVGGSFLILTKFLRIILSSQSY